jgi:peroxiredoxin
MSQLLVGASAPDFSLPDHEGGLFTLSTDGYALQNLLLVFNLGFV